MKITENLNIFSIFRQFFGFIMSNDQNYRKLYFKLNAERPIINKNDILKIKIKNRILKIKLKNRILKASFITYKVYGTRFFGEKNAFWKF